MSGDKERTATSRSVERKKMVRFSTSTSFKLYHSLIDHRSAGINDYIDQESIDNRQDTSMNETIIIDNHDDELGDESIIFSPASARSVNSSSLSSSPPPSSSNKKEDNNKSQILTQTIDALYVKIDAARQLLVSTRDISQSRTAAALINECGIAIKALESVTV